MSSDFQLGVKSYHNDKQKMQNSKTPFPLTQIMANTENNLSNSACGSTDTMKYGDFGIRYLERIFAAPEKFE